MGGYDVKRELRRCYAPKNADWAVVDVPPQTFIGIAGRGDPNVSPEYAAAVQALFAVGYAIKFASKRTLGRDFVVAPLEGLWWADDPSVFTSRAKESWSWRMLIAQPDWVTDEMIEDGKRTAAAKKRLGAIGGIDRVMLHEGTCAQVLHVGSYDDETAILARLHDDYLAAHHLEPAGPHHEVYLSDARRTEPTRLKTILRQPVTPRAGADRP